MRKVILSLLAACFCTYAFAQVPDKGSIRIMVVNEQKDILPGATVSLLAADSIGLYSHAAHSLGIAEFTRLEAGIYRVRVSQTGYETGYSALINLQKDSASYAVVTLKGKGGLLKGVTVVSKKQFIQFLPDKTVINPEANISNAGATVMDILEKSPGITVGKDGSIIMKGKPAVTILIDGKPTQLSGTDLQAYLSGISASQIDVVELIENPGAKYDASGNAGIINIKTKANRQRGFNGSVNLSLGQGVFTRTGNTINLNYREGRINWFLNYGIRAGKEKLDAYTLRKYFDSQNEDSVLLEQPAHNTNVAVGNNLKTGLDYFVNDKTTFGLVFTGGVFNKNTKSSSAIDWMDRYYHVDSSINTRGNDNLHLKEVV